MRAEGRGELTAQLAEAQAAARGLQRELAEQADSLAAERSAAVQELEARLAKLSRWVRR